MSTPALASRRFGVLIAALLCAPAARAQTLEPAGALDQIAPADARADRTASGQIGTPGRSVSATEVTAASGRRGSAPAQLGRAGDTAAPVQLAPAGRSVRGPAQLASGKRDAHPPAPLSIPAQGRTGAIARVEGKDRCDPATPSAARPRCAAVIETRGGDFPPPSREPLSPEQRLLVEQRTTEATRRAPSAAPGGAAIARSAARSGPGQAADADAPEMQGIASVVLAPSPSPPVRPGNAPTDGLTAEQAVIAIGIPGLVGATQP